MIDPAGPDLGPVQNPIQSSHIQLNMHMCISGTATAQKKHGNNASDLLVVRVRGVIGCFYLNSGPQVTHLLPLHSAAKRLELDLSVKYAPTHVWDMQAHRRSSIFHP